MALSILPKFERLGRGMSSRRRSHESVSDVTLRMYLQKLPSEILDMIYGHLSTRDAIALTLTCGWLYFSDVAAKYVHRPLRSSHRVRYHMLSILEDMRLVKGYHCRGCWERHPILSFSVEELRKSAEARYCLRTKRGWRMVSSGVELSFDEIAALSTKTDRETFFSIDDNDAFVLWIQSYMYITLSLFRAESVPTRAQFLALCAGFNIPICPHLRLNDKKITDQFPAKFDNLPCRNIRRQIEGEKECDFCATRVRLVQSEFGDPRVELKINRNFGELKSPRDPVWIAQTYSEKSPDLDAYCEEAALWLWGAMDDSENGRPLRPAPSDPQLANGSFFTPVTLTTRSTYVVEFWRRARERFGRRKEGGHAR
ncbi:hypothetical protein FQN54_005772 [Arachnomyces sp. PD_36]|nr:hypothetical protein FQN54_005772 [Arachnomyces sp. PD_36]